MFYEVWPGKKAGDPYEIRETTFIENGLAAFCGKTVEFVEDFVEACSRCAKRNKKDKGDNDE